MNLLAVISRFPYPIEKGDKLRAWYQLRDLAKHHRLHVVALAETMPSKEDLQAVEQFTESCHVIVQPKWKRYVNTGLGLFSDLPLQVHYFRSAKMKQCIDQLLAEKGIDVMYVQLIRPVINLPRRRKEKRYIDYMDCFSKGMQNRLELTSGLERHFVKIEQQRLKAYERSVADQFDGHSIISEPDAEILKQLTGKDLDVIPNGVGESFFEGPELSDDPEYDIIFTGNMGYHPNVQAALFLVNEILPELERRGRKLKVCLAGARPSPEVRKLASDQVIVTGFVDDLREYLANSRMLVAPLISGSGLQNKLLESMAMGLPTITSTLANDALGASPGEEILIGNDAKSFADVITLLLDHPEKGRDIGLKGEKFIRKVYLWRNTNSLLENVLKKLLRSSNI